MLVIAAATAAAATGIAAWGAYAPNSRLYGPVIGRGPREPTVFLTFDDGPNPGVTERILEVLAREDVPATFFMVGRYVERCPAAAAAVARAGYEIGNHTYTHVKLHRVGPRRAVEEIRRTHEVIADATGYRARSFRAPHGYRSPFVADALVPYRYRTFGWSFGVWDSACPGAERIRERVRRRLHPGAILLLHDGDGYAFPGDRRQTADALPGIIADARNVGYRFGRLADLVDGSGGKAAPAGARDMEDR